MKPLAALLALLLAACAPPDAPADAPASGASESDRRELALLTSLPILFSGGFSPFEPSSPLRTALEEAYRPAGIAVSTASELEGHDLLLIAHAQAQPAEALVDLDRWVREGGRVLMTADPRFAPERGIDLGGVPPFFADTGLLGRWGLALEGPLILGDAAVETREGAILATAPGRLRATDGGCELRAEGFVADCRVGEGRALVVADADWLVAEGEVGEANRAVLLQMLAELER